MYVVTAKHVFEKNPLQDGEEYAVVFRGADGIALVAISEVSMSRNFDVAACEVPLVKNLSEAVRLPIARTDPGLNEDVICFEYSSTRIERTRQGGTHVSFEPNAHKGNIVRSYVSTYPEAVPTPSLVTSFPALQGASGAPVLIKTSPRRTFAAVGIMVANVGRHLMPAQILTLHEEGEDREEVLYFLPYGQALARSVLSTELEVMGIPFEYADIKPTGGERSLDRVAMTRKALIRDVALIVVSILIAFALRTWWE